MFLNQQGVRLKKQSVLSCPCYWAHQQLANNTLEQNAASEDLTTFSWGYVEMDHHNGNFYFENFIWVQN